MSYLTWILCGVLAIVIWRVVNRIDPNEYPAPEFNSVGFIAGGFICVAGGLISLLMSVTAILSILWSTYVPSDFFSRPLIKKRDDTNDQ